MKTTRKQLINIIREVIDVPGWPKKHFAWRNVVFTRDGDIRYINDIASPETLGALTDMGEELPPGANVLVIMGPSPNSKSVWMHDSELLDLVDSEGWHERPAPKGADPDGLWDGKGEWMEYGDDQYELPPDLDLPPAIPEGRMKITKNQLKRIIREESRAIPRSMIKKAQMKITKRQLRRIIREAIDVINASTGEIMVFADEDDPSLQGWKPNAPELAAREIIKRLKLTPLENYGDRDSGAEPGVEEIWLGAEDYAVMDVEIGGKRHYRKNKKEDARMDIDNLLARATEWAEDAGGDYGADNPDADMEGVARDLAAGAKYSFAQDEWEALIWHFDERNRGEEDLIDFIADSVVG